MRARGFVIRLLLGAGLLAPSVVVPVTTTTGTPVALSVDIASVENQFFQLVNAERSKAGLPKLISDGGIVSMARSHSQAQSSAHRIYHSTIMRNLLSRCTLVGENVGRGPTVDAIHRALMNSPTHRREILGAFDRAGVGVSVDDTYIYVTQMFCQSDGTTPPPAAASAPKPAPKPAAPKPAPAPKVVAASAPAPDPAPVVVPPPPPPPPPPAGMGTPFRFL